MASPTGSEWRTYYTGPEWGVLVRHVTQLLAGIESHESSYSSTNYSTLTNKLADAIQALNDAAAADQSISNDGYPS